MDMSKTNPTKEQTMSHNQPDTIVEIHDEGTILSGADKHGAYYIARPFGRACCVTDRISAARRHLRVKEVTA